MGFAEDIAVRQIREEDRGAVRELLGEDGAIAAGRRAHVSASDARQGVGVWVESGAGRGELVLVVTNGRLLAPNNGRRLFYELARACAREALTRGVLVGRFRLRDERVVNMIARDFSVEPAVRGWDPDTREPVEWEVEVDVADAVRQLDRVLRRG